MIEFIPTKFHDINLGFRNKGENICTPYFPNFGLSVDNQVVVNIPDQIICNDMVSCSIIPLCGAVMIPEKRGLKYNHLSTPIVFVTKIDDDNDDDHKWLSGEIVDPSKSSEFSESQAETASEEEERQRKIAEAQYYSDDELGTDNAYAAGYAFNVNIVEYIRTPFFAGIYEIYVSMFGLESNRARVEIIIKNE
jgi:hypothetical protein